MEDKNLAKIASEICRMNDKLDRLIIILSEARKNIQKTKPLDGFQIGSCGSFNCDCGSDDCPQCKGHSNK